MVCPYCSTDMTPIELNGKTFCSNCGLTIANNSPSPVQSTINPVPETVSNIETQPPEEVDFPVIPEVVEAEVQQSVDSTPEAPIIPNPEEAETPKASEEPLIDYFGQFGNTDEGETTEPLGKKLDVITETPEPSMPITEETERDLGIVPEEPVLESKISELAIPNEEDFSFGTPEQTDLPVEQSYVELANPGDEQETLEASGILLDILGEEKPEKKEDKKTPKKTTSTPSVPTAEALNPVTEPELPAETETKEEDDDIYTLPTEVKVGLRNKKVTKDTPIPPDPKTEEQIEKLEEEIAEAPVPVVDVTPEEAATYDPDAVELHTIDAASQKAKVIKDYFSTAIEKDKEAKKKKTKKKKRGNLLRSFAISLLVIAVIAVLAVSSYLAYNTYNPANKEQKVSESASFSTLTPSYVPEGYSLTSSNYSDTDKTFDMLYTFTSDKAKTIVYKQIQTDSAADYISKYVTEANATYTEKVIADVTFTEVGGVNLLWAKDGFVFLIESKNFTFSNDLLYKMADSVSK